MTTRVVGLSTVIANGATDAVALWAKEARKLAEANRIVDSLGWLDAEALANAILERARFARFEQDVAWNVYRATRD